ncbi:uncharacterized protein LOC131427533 [Malaya genurostris]|uniref:uncharacterized protein LOC131427533 n=1 Tax=Malaya genurostris TaxID=325434 RepID=UPI0026F3C82A|nr:uncharacterized protein LOC131427533 [Malaya genurostris]
MDLKRLEDHAEDKTEANQNVVLLQNILDKNIAILGKLKTEYEYKLTEFYSMKAQESVLDLHLETWMHLHEKLEEELVNKHHEAFDARFKIWQDREMFCEISSQFCKDFSLEKTLAAMKPSDLAPVRSNPSNPELNKSDIVISPITSKQLEIDLEIEMLSEKEVELNRMEQEMEPNEKTIRLLQEAVHKSANSLEELEANIETLEKQVLLTRSEEDCTIKSILKRQSFVAPGALRKQVHFK